jgi:hypothetical protein
LQFGPESVLGDLHSFHLGCLLFEFVPKRRHRFVTLFNLRAQDLALVSGVTHLLQERCLIGLVLISLAWYGCDAGRLRAAMDSDSIGADAKCNEEQDAGGRQRPHIPPGGLAD